MVGIAQLVERWLVVPDVAGSSPVTHPQQEGPNLTVRAFFVSLVEVVPIPPKP
jgi:hypothetical protein